MLLLITVILFRGLRSLRSLYSFDTWWAVAQLCCDHASQASKEIYAWMCRKWMCRFQRVLSRNISSVPKICEKVISCVYISTFVTINISPVSKIVEKCNPRDEALAVLLVLQNTIVIFIIQNMITLRFTVHNTIGSLAGLSCTNDRASQLVLLLN